MLDRIRNKIKPIDIYVYILAIILDSVGVVMLMKTDFGATAFGIFISNAALIIPVSVGTISLIYEMIYIFAASKIGRSRIKIELLIYSAIFAVMVDLLVKYMPSFANESLVIKIGITLVAVVFSDLSKALMNVTIFPKLSIVEFIYAVVNRYGFRLDRVQRSLSVFNVLCGVFFSFFAGRLFYNVGVGTILTMLLSGAILQWTSHPIEQLYGKIKASKDTVELNSL